MKKLIFTGTFMLVGLGAFSAQELEVPKAAKEEAKTLVSDSAKAVGQVVQQEKKELVAEKVEEAKISDKKRKKPFRSTTKRK